jgi:hypothetical protein
MHRSCIACAHRTCARLCCKLLLRKRCHSSAEVARCLLRVSLVDTKTEAAVTGRTGGGRPASRAGTVSVGSLESLPHSTSSPSDRKCPSCCARQNTAAPTYDGTTGRRDDATFQAEPATGSCPRNRAELDEMSPAAHLESFVVPRQTVHPTPSDAVRYVRRD